MERNQLTEEERDPSRERDAHSERTSRHILHGELVVPGLWVLIKQLVSEAQFYRDFRDTIKLTLTPSAAIPFSISTKLIPSAFLKTGVTNPLPVATATLRST